LPGAFQENEAISGFVQYGADGFTHIPFGRWDLDAYFDPPGQDDSKSYVNHGAFIEGAALFDNSSYRISAAEANDMDPHQRKLLEVGYDALNSAGVQKNGRMPSSAGVFVGISNIYWSSLRLDSPPGALTGTAISGAISANRISFVHGLQGPSLAVDTACSSALVAINIGVSNCSGGSCFAALCASCEILLSPTTFILRTAARMLSVTGRCFTFDASANGYARGDGCAALLLSA
jgi:acyl transferase domain-containing protein